jgi:glycine cleavage system H protein
MTGNWFIYKDQKLFVTRSGYTGEDGFEVSMPNDLAEEFTKKLIENGAQLIGLGARDTLRLEAGLCLYGHELGENKTPIEANLKWAISKERMENGGFIGSDKIMNQINDGTKQIRVGIKPEGRLIAREKTKIFNEDELVIGEITSGTFGPSVSGPVAMGYVEKEFSKKDTKVFLEVRGKKHPANICGLPFYKKSYVKGATKMSEVKYSKEHEWIKIEGDVGTIGITQHATEMLGDIVFVELPDVGTSVEKDGNAGVVESTKAASDVFTPISGEVMENNQSIVDDPAKINSDPENDAWFFKLKIKDKNELDSLMNKDEYDKFAKESGS